MPLLDRNGLRPDAFVRAEGADIAGLAQPLVAWEHLPAALEALQPGQRLGVEVPNKVLVKEILPFTRHLVLIGIGFPAFSDGRGFSLARQLRNRGFEGTLRAVGPVIADQFAYAVACGFDEVELSEEMARRQPEAHWLAGLSAISQGYQRGYGDRGSILDQRRAARSRLRAAG